MDQELRSRPKAIIELQDPKTESTYTIEQKFVDKVLDFKNNLNGRAPTRYELAQLMKRVPETIEDEIEQMFRGFYHGQSYRTD
jgi:hypothetical protein